MTQNIQEKLKEFMPQGKLLAGRFGIEKENVRITEDAKLALTPHPKALGDKNAHPCITTDFSESQVEMVTPVFDTIAETLGFLETLHDVVTENIGDELLWPQSLPPILPEEKQIPIARYGKEGREKEVYRELLANIYGKNRQLISGIHYNFSFPESLLKDLQQIMEHDGNLESFKEFVYFRICRNLMRYRWLLIWLYGASPQTEETYQIKSFASGTNESIFCKDGISIRNCKEGYRNRQDFFIDFRDTKSYKQSIKRLIDEKIIFFEKELYAPVRVKYLENNTISHLELRMLDLNPLEKIGISKNTMYFTHLFLLYCLLKEEHAIFDSREQELANTNNDIIACHGHNEKISLTKYDNTPIEAISWACEIVEEIRVFAKDFSLFAQEEYELAWLQVFATIENPETALVKEIYKHIAAQGFAKFHLSLAKKYKEHSLQKGYRFYGLEDMELSTQLLLKEAVRRGVQYEILDRNENFIRLQKENHVEYIMQATKTSLDNYAGILLMENKHITKKLLKEAGMQVPKGNTYTDIEKARADFYLYKHKAIVVKPNTSNFGIGISILKNNDSEKIYNRALEIAFENGATVLIEEFFSGNEYRFFVIGHRVEGILRRIPANVVGDGKMNIKQLVAEKNKNPIRGKGYRTPLEKINCGEAEELFLQTQGLTFETVPAKGKTIYLRENSNISTGGDSIDYTDDIHISYKEIAIQAARALNVKITGLDMIIRNIKEPATAENYSIIELNFNPAIHIHCYPFKGKNRRLNVKILDALGL